MLCCEIDYISNETANQKDKIDSSKDVFKKKKTRNYLNKKKEQVCYATAVNRTRTSTLEGWNPNHWTTEARCLIMIYDWMTTICHYGLIKKGMKMQWGNIWG
jgi:hypothetical protein